MLALPFLTLSLHLPSALAEPATTDSVKQLMETTGSTQMSRQIVQQMIPMLKKLVPDAPDDFWDSFMKEINPEQINALVIPIYQKYLNEEDVQKSMRFTKRPPARNS